MGNVSKRSGVERSPEDGRQPCAPVAAKAPETGRFGQGGEPSDRIAVAIVALPESTAYVLFGLKEVLEAVGPAWGVVTGHAPAEPRFDVSVVASTTEPFACAGGAWAKADTTFAGNHRFDIVLVTDLTIEPDADHRGRWPEVAAWLAARHAEGAVIASVCSGSVLLAEAGLLDGREATTHWAFAEGYARSYPAVTWRPERILAMADAEERLVTAGGAASWEDLTLWLVARFVGPAEAVRLAKIYIFGDRSEGQLLYAALRRPRRHDDRVILQCQDWLADNYALPDVLAALIERSGLKEKSFTRRFKAATGHAPLDYVQRLRIEEAKELLETTTMAVEAIGRAVGYEDTSFFRRLFKRQAGTTPARYRQRFAGIGRSARAPGGR
jgi:transcriptional regulator GlxA family with amidase domain